MYFVYILVCLPTHRSYVGYMDNLTLRYAMQQWAGLTKTTREKPIVP